MRGYKFWGAGTVGSKGQVVIPAEAREVLNIKEGGKMLMVSPPHGTAIVMVKPEVLEEYMQRMQTNIKDIIDIDKETEKHK